MRYKLAIQLKCYYIEEPCIQILHKGSDKHSLLMRSHFESLDYRLQSRKKKKRLVFVIRMQIPYSQGKFSASQLLATIKGSFALKICSLPV